MLLWQRPLNKLDFIHSAIDRSGCLARQELLSRVDRVF